MWVRGTLTWVNWDFFSRFFSACDMSQQKTEIIRDCGLFCGLSEASLAKITDIARIVRFKRGHLIFRDGDDCPGIYVVGEGPMGHFDGVSWKKYVSHGPLALDIWGFPEGDIFVAGRKWTITHYGYRQH